MSTMISPIARAVAPVVARAVARAVRLGLGGPEIRRAGAVAVPLLVAGALAAGCGSAHTGAAPGSTASNAAPGHATVPAGPPASAAPVPTVSGGTVAPGQSACVGWPTGAASASLPVSFVPVSVERCVSGAQAIPGKGLWTTATLQRADSGLAGLISALRQPPATHRPGTVCPAVAVIPQQVVLIDANGRKLIPRLPASGCGLTQSQVLLALNELRWQPVSVRLIAKVPGATAPTVSGTAPRSTQTVSGVQPQ
jgi:hypothetical protein